MFIDEEDVLLKQFVSAESNTAMAKTREVARKGSKDPLKQEFLLQHNRGLKWSPSSCVRSSSCRLPAMKTTDRMSNDRSPSIPGYRQTSMTRILV